MAPRTAPKPRPAPGTVPDSLPRKDEVLPDDLRRTDQRETPPDSLPRPNEGHSVAGAPPIDGGLAEHPVHDDDLEDRGPEDFENEIEAAANAGFERQKG